MQPPHSGGPVRPGMLSSLERGGQAPRVLKPGPGFVSLRPQQAPLGHHWHHCLDLRTPKARKRRCSRPPPLGPARGLGAGVSGHPPSGGGSADHASSSLLTLPPPKQPFSTARLLQAATGQRQERPVEGEAKTGCCVCLGAGGATPQTLPAHHPALGPELRARHGLAAPLRRAPPAPAAARRPGTGSRTWPGPATALPGRPTRLPAPDSSSCRPPSRSAPSARGGQRLPGRAWPFPGTPGEDSSPA